MIVLRGRIVIRLERLSHLFKFFGCIKSVISMTISDQFFRILLVDALLFAFALAVGAVGTGIGGTFIRFKSDPFEAIRDIFFCTGYIAALVRIFYTEYEGSTMFFCKKIVVENSADTSEMRPPVGLGAKRTRTLFIRSKDKREIPMTVAEVCHVLSLQG